MFKSTKATILAEQNNLTESYISQINNNTENFLKKLGAGENKFLEFVYNTQNILTNLWFDSLNLGDYHSNLKIDIKEPFNLSDFAGNLLYKFGLYDKYIPQKYKKELHKEILKYVRHKTLFASSSYSYHIIEGVKQYFYKFFKKSITKTKAQKIALQEAIHNFIRSRKYYLRYEANRLVNTELSFAYNLGKMAVYSKNPEISHVQFICMEDEKLCNDCADLNGLIYSVEEANSLDWFLPPIHPNCRCTILPLKRIPPPEKGLDRTIRYKKSKIVNPLDLLLLSSLGIMVFSLSQIKPLQKQEQKEEQKEQQLTEEKVKQQLDDYVSSNIQDLLGVLQDLNRLDLVNLVLSNKKYFDPEIKLSIELVNFRYQKLVSEKKDNLLLALNSCNSVLDIFSLNLGLNIIQAKLVYLDILKNGNFTSIEDLLKRWISLKIIKNEEELKQIIDVFNLQISITRVLYSKLMKLVTQPVSLGELSEEEKKLIQQQNIANLLLQITTPSVGSFEALTFHKTFRGFNFLKSFDLNAITKINLPREFQDKIIATQNELFFVEGQIYNIRKLIADIDYYISLYGDNKKYQITIEALLNKKILLLKQLGDSTKKTSLIGKQNILNTTLENLYKQAFLQMGIVTSEPLQPLSSRERQRFLTEYFKFVKTNTKFNDFFKPPEDVRVSVENLSQEEIAVLSCFLSNGKGQLFNEIISGRVKNREDFIYITVQNLNSTLLSIVQKLPPAESDNTRLETHLLIPKLLVQQDYVERNIILTNTFLYFRPLTSEMDIEKLPSKLRLKYNLISYTNIQKELGVLIKIKLIIKKDNNFRILPSSLTQEESYILPPGVKLKIIGKLELDDGLYINCLIVK